LREVISSQRALILRSDNMEEKLNLVMASQKQTTSETTTGSTREHEVPPVKKVTTLGGETDKAVDVEAIGAVSGSLKQRPNLEASAQKSRDSTVSGVFKTIKAAVSTAKNVSNIRSATEKAREDVASVATKTVKATSSGAAIRVSATEKAREEVAAVATKTVKATSSGAAIRVSATEKARE
jgi:hypothetical protein